MSSALRQGIIDRLGKRQADAIEAAAQAGAQAAAATESAVSEERIVNGWARLLGRTMTDIYARQQKRGWVRRLFSDDDFMLERYSGRKDRQHSFGDRSRRLEFKVAILDFGIKTPVFDIETTHTVDHVFDEGWVVGVVEKSVQAGPFIPLTDIGGPIKIWRQVSERASGETSQQLCYEIGRSTIYLDSYTDGERDDSLATIGKEAGAHALGLMNRTLELLNS